MDKWVKKYNGLNSSLRGLGDIRHWAQAIRKDLQEINNSLEEICEQKRLEQRQKLEKEHTQAQGAGDGSIMR